MASPAGAMRVAGPRPAGAAWFSAPVLAAALAVAGILVAHRDTLASIVAIWIRSETYAHGFLVVPICLWLVWRRRDELAAVPARPWWPGLLAVALAGALWLAAFAADALGVRQFALAFMLIGAIVTVVGLRVARALVFPLAFLLFAVPAGEIFVPTLIDWTADFTVAALRVSGVPIYREANHFIIPSGAWSVVEACSGVRYLIASVMVGTIYAAVAYRSAGRRALFIAASIVVPVVANWLRAYLIVMIGHLSNNTLAVGVDHIIYGWIFFGVVMLALFWLGSFWREEAAEVPASGLGTVVVRPEARPAVRHWTFVAAAVAACAVAALWQPVAAGLRPTGAASQPVLSAVEAGNGWTRVPAFTAWKPHYRGMASELQQSFRDGESEVGVYIAFYRNQEKGRELVTSGNLLTARGDWNWKPVAQGEERIEWAGRSVAADHSEIAGPGVRLDVLRLYWVAGEVTASAYKAKALQAWSRLTGRGDDAALIVLHARRPPGGDDAHRTLRDFAQRMSPAIERALARTSAGTP